MLRRILAPLQAVIPFALLLALAAVPAGNSPGAAAASGWVPFAEGAAPGVPTVAVTYADAAAIELRAEVPGAWASPLATEAGAFTRLGGEGFVFGTQPGLPDLPVLRRDVEIPFGATYTLQVVAADARALSLAALGLPGPIAPLQPSQCKCRDTGPFAYDTAAYARDKFFPDTPVAATGEYVVRGHRVLTVELRPAAYNPARGSLRVYARLDVRVSLQGGDPALTRARAARYASPAFESTLAARVLNYNAGRPARDFAREPANTGYLIISADAYYPAMQPFAALKAGQGFQVTHTRLSEIPGGATNTGIRAYILDAYQHWSAPPSYVLLVGDVDNGADSMPTWAGPTIGVATDLYYATMDGPDDWVPDIHRGRFPARSLEQLNNMLLKNFAYANATGEEAWVKQAGWPATCDNYTVAEGTHNYVIDHYTRALGYTGSFPINPNPGGDQLYCVTYNAWFMHIMAAVNEGRSMLIYSGHGSYDGWEMGFNRGTVNVLEENNVFPFVASHACLSGDFGQQEVFGETWMVQANKGAIVYYGSSTYSYWGEDDILERAYFDALFDPAPGQPSVSAMSYAGLAGVQSVYPGSARYYWETYNILGDPSLEILLGPRQPDFTLSAAPERLQVCDAGQVTSTLTVGSLVGYTATVTLAAQGAPAGVVASLDPQVVTPPGSSLLALTSDGSAAPGHYAIALTGVAPGRAHTATVTLDVNDAAPGAPALLTPPDGATGQPVIPSFTWAPPAQATSYDLQIATDSAFTHIVLEANGLTEAAYIPAESLQTNTQYYWRVRAHNACGSGTYGAAFSFVTLAMPGDCAFGSVPFTLYREGFDGGAPGWTHAGSGDTWALSDARPHSGYAYHADDSETVSDQQLLSPPLRLPAGLSGLSAQFWNYQYFETSGSGCYDGGIAEISTDGGATWSQLEGTHMLSDPYDGTVSEGYGNPLAGLAAWCGAPHDWLESVVDLNDYAGQTVRLRFRVGTDTSVGQEGWYVDDVRVQACTAQVEQFYLPRVGR